MARNLVVSCDGTSNQYGARNTNVLRLHAILEDDPQKQLAYYDPGVGTFVVQPMSSRIVTKTRRALEYAAGRGLGRNAFEAYDFLATHYQPDDQIYLFGFSRGAYTVRVLAGMIHRVGLLEPHHLNLTSFAGRLYRHERNHVVSGFRSVFSRKARVRFIGLWDTVSSFGYAWKPIHLPHTANNPSVDTVRHAVAIDERRAFFRQNLWGKEDKQPADLRQVWFAGSHSDIGGAGVLARYAFEWMLVEAINNGLRVNPAAARAELDRRIPATEQPIEQSLRGFWHLGEFIPKPVGIKKEEKGRRRWRVNRGQPRWIAPDALVHQTAEDRYAMGHYRPENWPESPVVEPLVPFAQTAAAGPSATKAPKPA